MEGFTREEFMAKYGYDPEANLSGTPTKRTSFSDGVRSLAVGAATAIPSLLALPAVVGAGVGGAYDAATSDKKFMDSFGERLLVTGGKERIQEHINNVAEGYKEQHPTMTDAELNDLLTQYKNTKQFEDFSATQLVAGANLANRIEGGVRDIVGDERTAKERTWIDDALEVIGGSIIGLPASVVRGAGNAIAKNAVGRALLANPVSRGALYTAEALTPVTMPLNPTTFGINAGVGIGLNTGIRAATGQDTVFSGGSPDGPSGLAGAAGIAAAIGGGLLASGRIAGAASRAANDRAQLPANYPPSPATTDAFIKGSEEGAQLVAGPSIANQGLGVVPAVGGDKGLISGDKGLISAAYEQFLRGENFFQDENAILRNVTRKTLGNDAANEVEGLSTRYGGSAGKEVSQAEADIFSGDVAAEFGKLDMPTNNAAMRGWMMSSGEANNLKVIKKYNDEIDQIRDKVAKGTATPADGQRQAELMADLKRFEADDPTMRRQFIGIPRAEIQAQARYFETAPELEGVRQAIKRLNDHVLDRAVERGSMDKITRDEWRKSNPYYVPNTQDILEGATGAKRAFKGAWLRATGKVSDAELNQTNVNIFGSMNKQLGENANAPPGQAKKATQNIPTDPLIAIKNYARNSLIEINNNYARVRIYDILTNEGKNDTPLARGQHVMRWEDRNGRSQFSFKELGNPENTQLQAILDNKDYIRQVRDGKVEFVRYGDPEITSVLRFAPDEFTGIVAAGKVFADTMKSFTTGKFAPVFAPINAIYDTSVGAIFRRNPNNAFGPLDTAVTAVFGEAFAKATTRRFDVISPFIGLPYHAVRGMTDVTAAALVGPVSKLLLSDKAMRALKDGSPNALGSLTNFERSVGSMIKAINESTTMSLINKGIMRNNMLNDMSQARTAFSGDALNIKGGVGKLATYYSDLLSSIHGAPRRMIYAENHMLLSKKYGGADKIPPAEMFKLEVDTQQLSGDMTRRAGSRTIRQIEAISPFANAIRVSIHNMARSLISNNEGHLTYVYPRLFTALSGIAATHYMMNNWDENARRDFNLNTPEWMKNRFIRIPTMETIIAWFRGETVPYSDDKTYVVPIGPDMAPFVAGVSALFRGLGVFPNDRATQPSDSMSVLGKAIFDALLPVFPPAINVPLAAFSGGAVIDIGSADSRGGSILRTPIKSFVGGPQEEQRSNLSGVSDTVHGVLAAAFGSSGAYISAALDAGINATNLQIKDGQQIERERKSYMDGLVAATTTGFSMAAKRIPDYPVLWKGYDKEYVQTPAWDAVKEQKAHINAIRGMRDNAEGPRAEAKRERSQAEGGIVGKTLKDPVLIAIADDIRKWELGTKSPFALLKKEYTDVADARANLQINYTMDNKTRTEKVNELTRLMQDNMDQQRLAIIHQEGVIYEKYKSDLRGKLQGDTATFKELDRLMRADVARGLPSDSTGVFQASR